MIDEDVFLSERGQVDLAFHVGSDDSKKKLKAWVQECKEPFLLSDAARCIKFPMEYFERPYRVQLGKILSKLGCRRIEKRLGATRFSYLPPEI